MFSIRNSPLQRLVTPTSAALSQMLSGLSSPSDEKTTSIPSPGSDASSAPVVYPTDALMYELRDVCGRGASATVHRAVCKPLEEIVAIKTGPPQICPLDRLEAGLKDILDEARVMSTYKHPNILPLHCSFVHKNELWLVMPMMKGGSVAHIMCFDHPNGLSEVMCASIMREALRGLEYMHMHGGIHRDVKAGNILIAKDGSVVIGDFGVSATMERVSSWGSKTVSRTTMVGSPCWMAPEILNEEEGYGPTADIWSFGITLLELAHGHAPFSHFPPLKVLMLLMQASDFAIKKRE
eukprot:gene22111-29170_t